MGSLFNPSSSYWDSLNNDTSQFKKESNFGNSSQSNMFENNLCVEMKKKEFGFPEYNSFYNADNSEDDRRSVDRLVRELLAEEREDVANSISISKDPRQWSVAETCAWLRHYATRYNIPGDITEFLTADGNTLCSYTTQDFTVRIGCETAANQIKAQLDNWKQESRSMNGGARQSFQKEQGYMNLKLEAADQCRSHSAKYGLDINGGWAPAPSPQVFTPPQPQLVSPNPYVNNTNNMEPNRMRATGFQEMARSSFQPFVHNTQMPAFPTTYLPKPTIPLDRFRSVREASQDGFLSFENYQKFTNMTPPQTMMSMSMFANMGGGSTSKGTLQIPDPTSPGFNDNYNNPAAAQPPQMARDEPEPEMKTPVLRDLDEEEIEPSYIDLNIENMKQEVQPDPAELPQDTDPPIQNPPTEKPPKKKSNKHPIHLWEFLKQLLQDGKDCIRWLDEEKGVFKIYNSQQVAKYWGERKNRPAMNYDKLSRSIRQYYKKGIIKKTPQSKRLVYQFCEAYL